MEKVSKKKTVKVKKEKKVPVSKEKKLSDISMIKIEVALDMYKIQIPLYIRYKEMDNDDYYNYFCSFSRSIIFDITNVSFFEVGLISEEALKKLEETTREHYFNRKLTGKVLFEELIKNPNMTVEEFIEFLKKYGTLITLTKSEHNKLPKNTKGFYEKTPKVYTDAGIVIPGLEEYDEYLKTLKY